MGAVAAELVAVELVEDSVPEARDEAALGLAGRPGLPVAVVSVADPAAAAHGVRRRMP